MGEHYVWCCPYFDAAGAPRFAASPPPTSCPKEIYLSLADEVERGDRHSKKIDEARAGILRGARFKREAGIITPIQEKRIQQIVELAERREFYPLLLIIPFDPVKALLVDPEPDQKAHPLSPEFIIEHLPRSHFDVVDFGR